MVTKLGPLCKVAGRFALTTILNVVEELQSNDPNLRHQLLQRMRLLLWEADLRRLDTDLQRSLRTLPPKHFHFSLPVLQQCTVGTTGKKHPLNGGPNQQKQWFGRWRRHGMEFASNGYRSPMPSKSCPCLVDHRINKRWDAD